MIKAVVFLALVSYANAGNNVAVPVATNVAFGSLGNVAPAGLLRSGAARAGPIRAAVGQIRGAVAPVAGIGYGAAAPAAGIGYGAAAPATGIGYGGARPAGGIAYAAPAAAAGIAPIAVAGPAYNYAVPSYGAIGASYSSGPLFQQNVKAVGVAPAVVAPAVGLVKTAAVVAPVAQIQQYSYPLYNFGYSVSDGISGDQKNQIEYRDGGVVKGSYSLVEPDGNIRTVTYHADDINGFTANVVHTGPTVHRGGAILTPLAAPVAAVAPVVAPVAVKAAAVVAPVAVKAAAVVKA